MDVCNKEYANPFNWIGSKHRYMKELLSVLPLQREGLLVLDPFVGGGDLISKLPTSWKITASDTMDQLIDLHKMVQSKEITPDLISKLVAKYKLSRIDQDRYLELRNEYNETKDPKLLYLLMTSSFNNQMRFNSKGGFNMPFGARMFNERMSSKLDNYSKALNDRVVTFYSKPYKFFDFSDYDLLLIDPPYSNTTATYNESTKWSEVDDGDLFKKIDGSGTDFIYFNQTYSKGVPNNTLINWMSKYNYVVLKDTSKGCSYNRGNDFTEEVMVYNVK